MKTRHAGASESVPNHHDGSSPLRLDGMTTPGIPGGGPAEELEARIEALQVVVDRVSSWQESAPERTVREELDAALEEVGLDLDDATRRRIVEHIHDGDAERTDVRRFLT